jgi:anti-sigma factor RsiW
MFDEQLEFAISQYADGTLPPSRRDALEAQIADDPALSQLLKEYRQLGSAFRIVEPLPSIDFDRLATHLSDCVSEQDEAARHVPIYQMPWVRRVVGLAVAACLAIIIGVEFDHVAVHGNKPAAGAVGPVQLAVTGPAADAPAGAVVSLISIGPSPAVATDDSALRYSDSDVVAQPQRVVIASSDAPVQDTPVTPY